jgi:phosphoribosylanthranilate isomerase
VYVKICGITTTKAALAAAEAGADGVGFIFVPGVRRQVDPDRVLSIVAGLPDDLLTTGVFVNEQPEEIRRIAAYTGLRAVQLHGDEPPEALAEFDLPVTKALKLRGPDDLAGIARYRQAAALLLEPHVPGQHGGTGTALDWTLVRWAAESLLKAGVALARPDEHPLDSWERGAVRLVLAGGLTPENVVKAVRQANPGGVDVSSGVETNGEKDIDKIYRFIAAARGSAE